MHLSCTPPHAPKDLPFSILRSFVALQATKMVSLNVCAPHLRRHFSSRLIHVSSYIQYHSDQIWTCGVFLNVLPVMRLLPLFFIIWSFVRLSQPPLKSASMIMIKRMPQRVRLSDPAMPPPPGMPSNFVNPSNLKTEGAILVGFCLTVSTLVVCMRIWTKTRLLRKVVLEDCNSTLFRSCWWSFLHWPLQGFAV